MAVVYIVLVLLFLVLFYKVCYRNNIQCSYVFLRVCVCSARDERMCVRVWFCVCISWQARTLIVVLIHTLKNKKYIFKLSFFCFFL